MKMKQFWTSMFTIAPIIAQSEKEDEQSEYYSVIMNGLYIN